MAGKSEKTTPLPPLPRRRTNSRQPQGVGCSGKWQIVGYSSNWRLQGNSRTSFIILVLIINQLAGLPDYSSA